MAFVSLSQLHGCSSVVSFFFCPQIPSFASGIIRDVHILFVSETELGEVRGPRDVNQQ